MFIVWGIIILILAIPIQNGMDIERTKKFDNDPTSRIKSGAWMKKHNYHKNDRGSIVDKDGNIIID